MSLRVLSYNVRYAELDTGENRWPKRRDGVADVVRFHEPDVVCLQEVWQGQLPDLRARLSGYEWVARRHNDGEHTPIGYRPDRLSPTEETAFSLSETPVDLDAIGWEAAVPRVTTTAVFTDATGEADGPFRVVSTHFDHLRERARRRSAELLAERFGGAAEPTILAGDLNCTPADPPHERLLASGFRDARAAIDRPHGPESTFNDFGTPQPDSRIDHVLVDGGVDIERFGVCTDLDRRGLYPSDHFPVLVDCDLA